jgi:hypothetical protein
VRLVGATELGLALVFLGRSFTRIYVRRAVDQFGAHGIALARMPESDVIPTWVSIVLLGGWAIALVSAAGLLIV